MAKSVSTEVRGQGLTLYGRKAVYWHEAKTLMLADTHWGKAEVFQEHGIPIPSSILESDLHDITALVHETGALRILVLGDLLHSAKPMSPQLMERIAAWRILCPIPLFSIRGNHDPKETHFPKEWDISWLTEPHKEGPFCFRHEPKTTPGFFTWCGHVHPVIHLGRPRMRLPAFWISADLGMLPSFGTFTGGFAVKPRQGDSLFVALEGEIVCLTSNPSAGDLRPS